MTNNTIALARTRTLMAFSTLLLTLLAACSGGEGASTAGEEPTGDTAAETSTDAAGEEQEETEAVEPERREVTVSQLSPAPVLWANLWIPEPLGYYDEEGLDVTFIAQQPRATNEDNLVRGETDFTNLSNAFLIPWVEERESDEVKILMADHNYLFLMMLLEDSPVQDVAELRGTTIGIREATDQETLELFMSANGIGPDEYETLAVGGRVAGGVALQGGEIDALLGTIVDRHFIESADIPLRQLQVPGTEDFYNSGVGTRTELIEDDRDLVIRFLRAAIKGSIWQHENPEATIELLGEVVPESVQDREASLELLQISNEHSRERYEQMFRHEEEVWQDLIDFFTQAGVIESFPASNIVDTELLDEVLASFDVEEVQEAARQDARP